MNRVTIDMTVKRFDDGFGVGAEYKIDRQAVKVASLFYPINEYESTYACLRAALPELLKHAERPLVIFRSGISQFASRDRLSRSLEILANQDEKTVVFKRWYKPSSASDLADDARARRSSIIIDV
ncbi:hypothetical protein AABM38_10110 [Heyndrickxia sp. MSNUG]|uniref:hypothetical protein n=1 Tax=Heyndrickxia sp. MSNUG TaxID=3136677 RepID=UPI003C2BE845